MEVQIINVTPRMAAEWLATSEGNPRWKSKTKIVDNMRVEAMANDILRGQWNPRGNGIVFNAEGHLVDGHHRLSAIVKAGRVVECIVVRGVTELGEAHIDDNRRRTDSQRSGYSALVMGVPSVHLAELTSAHKARLITYDDKIRWIELHPAVHAAARIANTGTSPKVAKLTRKAGVIHGLMCAIEYGVSDTKLERFVSIVNTGIYSGVGETPAVMCRNFLLDPKVRSRDVDSRLYTSHVTQAAVYDFLAGAPRMEAYKPKRGRLFDANIARGDKRYMSFFGEVV